jgi:hypothetical protein
MSNVNHPIYDLVRLGMILLFLWGLLYYNASEFDATELKVIGGMAIALCGSKFIERQIANWTNKRENK